MGGRLKGHQLVEDVAEQHYFYVSDGSILKNVLDLKKKLAMMKPDVFSHHVSKEHNDFYNWVRDVQKDSKLASALLKAHSQQEAISAINERLRELATPIKKKAAVKRKTAKQKPKTKELITIQVTKKANVQKPAKQKSKKTIKKEFKTSKKRRVKELALVSVQKEALKDQELPLVKIVSIPEPPPASFWQKTKQAVKDFVFIDEE